MADLDRQISDTPILERFLRERPCLPRCGKVPILMSGYEGQVRRTLAEKGIRSLTALDIEKALLNVV